MHWRPRLAFGAVFLLFAMSLVFFYFNHRVASDHVETRLTKVDSDSRGGGECRQNKLNCAATPNPLARTGTIWLEQMTWMDVRDAIAHGMSTVIIPTGGIEPSGPWLVLGKHNLILQSNCEAIARSLGTALCAPIIAFVPEGDIEPPSGHMQSPGTISVSQDTFRALLKDVASSLRAHGFKAIFLIGDSGGNQDGQREIAKALSLKWGASPLIAHIPEYYDYPGAIAYLSDQGIVARGSSSDGLHDDPAVSLNVFHMDPNGLRFDARVSRGEASIDGLSLMDRDKTQMAAKKLVAYRAERTVEAIRKRLAAHAQ